MGDLDGLYDGRTNTLHISAKAQNPLRVVITHEITHAMKTSNPAGYRVILQSAAFQMMQETGDLERVSAMLGESYGEMTQDELNEELVAHFMQNTMEDIGQFERLIGVNRNVAQRLLDALEQLPAAQCHPLERWGRQDCRGVEQLHLPRPGGSAGEMGGLPAWGQPQRPRAGRGAEAVCGAECPGNPAGGAAGAAGEDSRRNLEGARYVPWGGGPAGGRMSATRTPRSTTAALGTAKRSRTFWNTRSCTGGTRNWPTYQSHMKI